jgi:hypothetical protein
MSTAGKQFSLVGGIGSGAGAYAVGTAVDQTGNLLNTPTTVLTPNAKVGVGRTNFGGKKVRFGVVSKDGGKMFDYPDLAIKNAGGNGQAYKASKGGYLPGNNGGGQAGYGLSRDVDLQTKVSEDLLMAQGIAQRSSTITADMYGVEHTRAVDRATEDMREHFEEQAKEHELNKIKHLMAMGFSEREIAEKAMRDREKAIEQASKMMPQSNKLEDALMKAKPASGDSFWNNSIAPGAIPNRINADSYQRATGLGTRVTKGKAAEAMRRREAMALKIDAETPQVKTPMKHAAIVEMMMGIASKEEHKRLEESKVKEEQIIHHQKVMEHARMARHFAMKKAMET